MSSTGRWSWGRFAEPHITHSPKLLPEQSGKKRDAGFYLLRKVGIKMHRFRAPLGEKKPGVKWSSDSEATQPVLLSAFPTPPWSSCPLCCLQRLLYHEEPQVCISWPRATGVQLTMDQHLNGPKGTHPSAQSASPPPHSHHRPPQVWGHLPSSLTLSLSQDFCSCWSLRSRIHSFLFHLLP